MLGKKKDELKGFHRICADGIVQKRELEGKAGVEMFVLDENTGRTKWVNVQDIASGKLDLGEQLNDIEKIALDRANRRR
jgi:hypothetical protein